MNDRSPDNLFLHADGDSFFVACELVDRPELRGLPVIVGEDRGIAVAMSHEAKALGVTRGMPVFKIKKNFPEVIILPHHFERYRKISEKMYALLLSYFDTVEAYSIDECFALVRPSDIRFHGSAEKMLEALRNEINRELGVTYSLGLARTKSLAKTASKLRKPNGVVALLGADEEHIALEKTHIEDVWGIGWRTAPKLRLLGLKTAADFVQYDRTYIEQHFSESLVVLQCELAGEALHSVHADVDPRDQKSIQSTCTFRPASADRNIIWAELAENAEAACAHARKLRLLATVVSFFIKTTDFRYRFGDAKLPLYTSDPGPILNVIEPLLSKLLLPGEKIRSTGVILDGLRREEDVPRDLFGAQAHAIARLAVEEAADRMRGKYGASALKRLSSLKGSGKETDSSFR